MSDLSTCIAGHFLTEHLGNTLRFFSCLSALSFLLRECYQHFVPHLAIICRAFIAFYLAFAFCFFIYKLLGRPRKLVLCILLLSCFSCSLILISSSNMIAHAHGPIELPCDIERVSLFVTTVSRLQ